MRRFREQLRAEADTERRRVEIEQPLQEEVLFPQPGVMPILIGVHRTTEDEHGTVRIEWARQRRPPGKAPLLERMAARANDVAEHARAHALPMDDGQDVH